MGSFTSSNVGTDQAVTVTGLTLTGADAGNYLLNATNASGDITPAPLTVTGVSADNKVYDGNTTATIDIAQATIVGAVPTDAVALSVNNPTGTFNDQNVGTDKAVTVSGLSLIGAAAGQLHPDSAGTDRQYHRRASDRHGHHGKQQGLRRHHSTRHARYLERHPGRRGFGRRRGARLPAVPPARSSPPERRHEPDGGRDRTDADRYAAGELLPDAADDDREHHARPR